MVKHSKRNRKHKKNSSRRNIKLKNPKHHKKRATTFRKKPFNLRSLTLKKRQHGGATLANLQALNNLLPADDNNPRNWTPQNNPFNNMSLDAFQRFRDEVNRIFTEQGQAGFSQIQNFAGQRRGGLRRIKTFIDNNDAAIRTNIAQQALAPVPPPNQGQVGVDNALAAQLPPVVVNQGQPPPPPPVLANQGQVAPAPLLAPVPLPVNQGQVGVANALVANQGQVVPAPIPAPVVAANQGPPPQPAPPADQASASEQVITINITAPPDTIANLGGNAQLNQNNLAQVDIALADLVQNFAR